MNDMNNINIPLIKDLILKKYEYVDFIFNEILPNPNPITISCSIPQIQQFSTTHTHVELTYKYLIEIIYKKAIQIALKNFENETKAWFSIKFAKFSFSEIIRKTLLALNTGNFKYIILPKSVYEMFLTSEMDVYMRILNEGNFNKTKIKFNSIVPPFFTDINYDHINAYFIDGIEDIYLLQNELFDIRKFDLHLISERQPQLASNNQNLITNLNLNANYIHKIKMYQNDQVLSNHLKLKKIKLI